MVHHLKCTGNIICIYKTGLSIKIYKKPVCRIISMSMPLQSQLQNVKEMRQLKLQ